MTRQEPMILSGFNPMTRQEVLTKLAMDFKSWESAFGWLAVKADIDDWGTCGRLSRQDWLAERERLLNTPKWEDLPLWVNFIAIDADGLRSCFGEMPEALKGSDEKYWAPSKGWSGWEDADQQPIALPAGFNWTESLEARPE